MTRQNIQRALALHRAMNARRLRGDEVYQDRLEALFDRLVERPSDAGTPMSQIEREITIAR